MGDLEPDANSHITLQEANEVKDSIDILKETRELADITHPNSEPPPLPITTEVENNGNVGGNGSGGADAPKNVNVIETVYENVGMDKSMSSVVPIKQITNPICEPAVQELSNNSFRSTESGRLNKLRDHSSNIFPAGIMGCRDNQVEATSPRRLLDANEAMSDMIGHIDSIAHKMTVKQDPERNPLTGHGVDAADEMKRGSARRQGGNPLLGVGYEDKATSNSTTRIPPGGFSHGLW